MKLPTYKLPLRTRLKIRVGMLRIWLMRRWQNRPRLMVPAIVVASLMLVVGAFGLETNQFRTPNTPTASVDIAAVYEKHQALVRHARVNELQKYATQIELQELKQQRLREKITLARPEEFSTTLTA